MLRGLPGGGMGGFGIDRYTKSTSLCLHGKPYEFIKRTCFQKLSTCLKDFIDLIELTSFKLACPNIKN